MIDLLFEDKITVDKIKSKLPALFYQAEYESSRAGKIGMEVGSVREKILIALLIYKFGRNNVKTNIPITEPETDVLLFDNPISIKTMTGNHLSGVKISWTVDRTKVLEFVECYQPKSAMLVVHINWQKVGGLYYFSREQQTDLLASMGREMYFKIPRPGTNPRGIEISNQAIRTLGEHKGTRKIEIEWNREVIKFDPYKKWVEIWEQM